MAETPRLPLKGNNRFMRQFMFALRRDIHRDGSYALWICDGNSASFSH